MDTSYAAHFAQASEDLHRAAYDSTRALRGTLINAIAAERRARARTRNLVPMGVMAYDVAYIDTLAVKEDLLKFDPTTGHFADVPGRGASPFVRQRLASMGA